eukprot:TRINITY_DN6464_c0_g1_i3.p1 TRINITY_DN6464_c0_g1~~TRINITY_DN6464_c0_g1_i3.p1  ORF type:complete len:695 (+),score=177.68 TRINITY_DN6464_c0_g1_i3:231-2315(+)
MDAKPGTLRRAKQVPASISPLTKKGKALVKRMVKIGIDKTVCEEVARRHPTMEFEPLLQETVLECARRLRLPSVPRRHQFRRNPDAALLQELIAQIDAEFVNDPMRTYPYHAAPNAGSQNPRTQQLVHGLAAGRSSTIGGATMMDEQSDDPLPRAGPVTMAMQLSQERYSDQEAPQQQQQRPLASVDLDDLPSPAQGHERASSVIIHPSAPLIEPLEYEELSDINPSPATLEKSAACVYYLQQHFIHLHRNRVQRVRHRHDLEEYMEQRGLDPPSRAKVRAALIKRESNHLRRSRAPITKDMFQVLKPLGRGAFGQVSLVRCSEDGGIYALKAMSKRDIVQRGQVAHVKAERDLLAQAENDWVVKLHYSFQDETQLYFAMEYLPGGDLMTLLIEAKVFPEEVARFYLAELVMAVSSVHAMGFIHRDIKPDNILIDRNGHIKLADFGLCTGFKWTHHESYYNASTALESELPPVENDCGCAQICTCGEAARRQKQFLHQSARTMADSLVGTPNYIAPEVFLRRGHDHRCDWWSIGVILFEMLYGHPPFCAPTPIQTRDRVINWQTTLKVDQTAEEVSMAAKDLILRLCCDVDHRIGSVNGVKDIMDHEFFKGIAWNRQNQVFWAPELSDELDTSRFDNNRSVESLNLASLTLDAQPNAKRPHRDGFTPDRNLFREFNFRRFWSLERQQPADDSRC